MTDTAAPAPSPASSGPRTAVVLGGGGITGIAWEIGVLARLLEAVERHAPVSEAELVGVPPAKAFEGWPERVPVRNRQTLEDFDVLV